MLTGNGPIDGNKSAMHADADETISRISKGEAYSRKLHTRVSVCLTLGGAPRMGSAGEEIN